MNTLRRLVPLAFTAALGLGAAANAAGTVQLTHPPKLTSGDAALPKIAAPVTPATAKINAALARIDARWIKASRDCLGHAKPQDAEMTRSVETPMLGPRYLTIVAHDSASCAEAAYPQAWTLALVYDLDTGRPVNWEKLLGTLVDSAVIDSAGDGTPIGVITSNTLHDLYVKAVAPRQDPGMRVQCANILEDETMQFQVWPDAAKGGLVLQPSSLPHAVAACGDAAVIPLAKLRRLGVDAGLLDAIAAGGPAAR